MGSTAKQVGKNLVGLGGVKGLIDPFGTLGVNKNLKDEETTTSTSQADVGNSDEVKKAASTAAADEKRRKAARRTRTVLTSPLVPTTEGTVSRTILGGV